MPEKYKNKYRIPSARYKGWNYGWDGYYFVTICTKNREHFFGNIVEGKMILSEIGEMVEKYWYEIPKHFSFVRLDAFVVMPNHFHAIVIIDKNNDKPVETHCNASLQQRDVYKKSNDHREYQNKFGPQKHNLASIIRGFKGTVTKQVNERFGDEYFAWQPRFHEHIIRNEIALERIRKYIKLNPWKWQDDCFFK